MKGQWSKLFVVTVVFLLLAGVCACAPAASHADTCATTATPPTHTNAPHVGQSYRVRRTPRRGRRHGAVHR